MRSRLLSAVGTTIAFVVPACSKLSEQVVPLGELSARSYISHMGRLALGPAEGLYGDPCPVLREGTTATLNGVPARTINPGGIVGEDDPEIHPYCSAPAFNWPPGPTEGISTFEISDGTTTWAIEVWRPFEMREFSVVSHPTLELRASDPVIAEVLAPEDGPLVTARTFVRADRDGAVLFDLTPPNDLVIDGHDLHFQVPDDIEAGPFSLWIESVPTVEVRRCDAPLGCEVAGRAVVMLDATIVR